MPVKREVHYTQLALTVIKREKNYANFSTQSMTAESWLKNRVVAARNVRTSRKGWVMVRVADSQMSEGCIALRIDEDRGGRNRRRNFSFILT
jgi:hypothetical protein